MISEVINNKNTKLLIDNSNIDKLLNILRNYVHIPLHARNRLMIYH